MRLYKLTDQNHETKGRTKWGSGVTHKVKSCKHPSLCSKDVLHAYKSKELALLLNPIHANVSDPVIWEATGNVAVEDWGKIGVFELTTTRMMQLPKWYRDTNTRKRVQVMFAVLCAAAAADAAQADDAAHAAAQADDAAHAAAHAAYAAAHAAHAAHALDFNAIAKQAVQQAIK